MQREEFYTLDILRGLSALLVIFYHFFIFFFTQQEFSAHLLNLEPLDLQAPFYLPAIEKFPLDLGHFGVSFFFLISGFLIQPSLQKQASLKSFLRHKFFRLWPSYAFCFSIGLTCVFIFSAWRGYSFPYSFPHILSYFTWMRDIFNYPYIDGAVWTLEIQIKFYILAGIFWYFGGDNFLEKLCVSCLLLSLLVFSLYNLEHIEHTNWFYVIKWLRTDAKFFLLMLLGSCTYSFYKKQISLKKYLTLCFILIASFISPVSKLSSFKKTYSYLLGSALFILFLLLKKKERKDSALGQLIKKVSHISYPLYIGHVLPGYTLMYFMTFNGLSLWWGLLIALPCIFLLAYFVHEKIEKPISKHL